MVNYSMLRLTVQQLVYSSMVNYSMLRLSLQQSAYICMVDYLILRLSPQQLVYRCMVYYLIRRLSQLPEWWALLHLYMYDSLYGGYGETASHATASPNVG